MGCIINNIAVMNYAIFHIPDSGASEEDKEIAHSTTVTQTKVQRWKKTVMREKTVQAMWKEYVSENFQYLDLNRIEYRIS